MQPPDGPPVCTALNCLPSGMPPPISWMISRSVIPMGTSIRPVFVDPAGQREHLGALALLRADGGEPLRAVAHDGRDIGEGLHVVDQRGTLPQPRFRREGRPRARRAALAFDAGDQRRLLAADEGARAQPYVDVETEARAADAVAQQAQALGLLDGRLEVLHGQRILGAHVDEALLRAHRVGRDRHAFQHAVRIALQHGAIHERAGVAFVGVADHVLLLLAGLGDGAPLQARGIARAAAPAQAAASSPAR